MNYFCSAIATMQAYTPGEQPKLGTPIIKLNTNENPYPPSPKALEVLRLDSEWLRRYPDPYSRDFCQAVSKALNVPADWVIVTNGSDDMLNILIRACGSGKERKVVYPMPSYVLYRTLASLQAAEVVEVDYPVDFQLSIVEQSLGKSCYIRQIGLIQLIAQIGSFVPATEAKLAICDRIFTRVGAVDDLATGQSTFMVEMNETANILNHET